MNKKYGIEIFRTHLTYETILRMLAMKRTNEISQQNNVNVNFETDDENLVETSLISSNGSARRAKRKDSNPVPNPQRNPNKSQQLVNLRLPIMGREIKGGQRVHIRWDESETNALIQGIREFGIGDWKTIRDKYSGVFDKNKRTKMDLSRRWQTLKEQGQYSELYDHYSSKSRKRK